MRRTVLAAALAVLGAATASVADERGVARVVGSGTVDFGKYKAMERKVARHRIRNEGQGVLRIVKVRKGCGCATAESSRSELKPGEETEIKVVILANSISGRYSKNTYVETSDPGNRYIRLVVSGDAVPLVEVKPKPRVNIGRIAEGKKWTQAFELIPTEEGVRLGAPKVESACPVQATTAPLRGNTGGISLRLSVETGNGGDAIRCRVSVPVASHPGHPPVKLEVTGKAGVRLFSIPSGFRLLALDRPQTRKIHLRVLGDKGRTLKPDELVLPDVAGVVFDVSKEREGRGLVVECICLPEFVARVRKGKVELEFSVPGAPAARVSCSVRE